MTTKEKGNLTEILCLCEFAKLGLKVSIPYGEDCKYDFIITNRYTLNDIDFFATIDDGQCYLVPVNECGARKTLRYCYPRNGQKKGISLAENYKLEDMIKQFE